MRSSVFIGSSSEGLEVARTLQLELDHDAEVELWSQGVFGLSDGTRASLVAAADRFDFAVLDRTADDMVTSRGKQHPAACDNVLFELGLFMGGLDVDRTFLLYDRTHAPALPSDLAGVTSATSADGSSIPQAGRPKSQHDFSSLRIHRRSSARTTVTSPTSIPRSSTKSNTAPRAGCSPSLTVGSMTNRPTSPSAHSRAVAVDFTSGRPATPGGGGTGVKDDGDTHAQSTGTLAVGCSGFGAAAVVFGPAE